MSVIGVTVGGSDITSRVVFETARYETAVNGVASEAKFRVRDEDRSYVPNIGDEVVLTIDSVVAWRGFLMKWTRTYAFPALNVTDFGLARFFDATCSDINVLLTKRFVFDQGDGANILAPLLPAHTADTTAIADLFASWIDLSGDGIDTTSLVENVGDTTWTQEGRAWEGSDSWMQAFQSIGQLPAAIFYINPDKKFVYTDVDTPNAPFGLSDQPNHTTTKGYSSMEILKDGTGLANDVMCWGVGYGSQVPVFKRDIDATSVSEHGVWQFGQTSFGVYEQTTIDRIAESIIDGSPDSKRGAKDDRVAVMVTTYEPGLRAADKVPFTSNVFGFSDTIPIRKMVIAFDSPVEPRYELTLSHEIDTPFGFFDPFLFNLWRPGGFVFPPFPPTGPILPGQPACSPAVCSITDLFDRSDVGSWGEPTCLLDWVSDTNTGGTIGVDGAAGTVHLTSHTAPRRLFLENGVGGLYQTPFSSLVFRVMRFQLPDVDATSILNAYTLEWAPTDHPGLTQGQTIYIGNIDFGVTANSGISFGVLDYTSDPLIPHAFWQTTSTYTVTQWWNGAITQFSISDGVNTYTVSNGMTPTVAQDDLFFNIVGSLSAAITYRILEHDIPEINRCTVTGTPTACYTGGPAPTPLPSGNAWVCESFSPATAVLTLARPFLALSTIVFVNGLVQPPSAYTPNPTAGTITLGFTPVATDNARVCYWSLP